MKKALQVLGISAVLAAAIPTSAFAATANADDAKANVPFVKIAPAGKAGGMFKLNKDMTDVLNLLKLDEATLKQDLASGKSLADIAEEQGVTRQQLIDTETASFTKTLDQNVQDGKMTQEQADKIKTNLAKTIDRLIDAKGNGEKRLVTQRMDKPGPSGFPGMDMKSVQDDVLKALGLDEQTYQAKREAGETLAQIASEQGVSRDDLKNALTAAYNNMLDKAKSDFAANVETLIDSKGGGFGFGKEQHVKIIQRTDLSAMAGLLNLDEATLKQDLGSGKSLADIAGEQGVDVQKLIDAQAAQLSQDFADALQNGKMTQEQINDMAAKIVNDKGGTPHHFEWRSDASAADQQKDAASGN